MHAMHTPTNSFKQALAQGEAQIGLWLGLADADTPLAESWQVASDGVSATFKLRDVKFHSKRPVTAAAAEALMVRVV